MGNDSFGGRLRRLTFWLLLAGFALGASLFGLSHLQTFDAIIMAAIGLYVIWVCRIAYRDPDEAIGAWQWFYWYLRPGSPASRRFLGGLGQLRLACDWWLLRNWLLLLPRK